MHAAYTFINSVTTRCMGINSPGTILRLNRMINMVRQLKIPTMMISSGLAGITTNSWSAKAAPMLDQSKRLAKISAKYRIPTISR